MLYDACGAHGGGVVPFDIRGFYRKHQSILSAAGGPRHDVPMLLRKVAQGSVSRVIHRIFALADVATAHALVNSRDVFGRIAPTL